MVHEPYFIFSEPQGESTAVAARLRAISKTPLGLACELRMYKELTGQPPDSPDHQNDAEESPGTPLLRGRAYHQAVAAVHRVWARPGSSLDLDRLPELYGSAWAKSGGDLSGPPD